MYIHIYIYLHLCLCMLQSLVQERDEALKAGIALPPSYHNLLDMLPKQCTHISGNINGLYSNHDTPSPTVTPTMTPTVTYDPDQPLDLSASGARSSSRSSSSSAARASPHVTTKQHTSPAPQPLKVPHVDMKLKCVDFKHFFSQAIVEI